MSITASLWKDYEVKVRKSVSAFHANNYWQKKDYNFTLVYYEGEKIKVQTKPKCSSNGSNIGSFVPNEWLALEVFV